MQSEEPKKKYVYAGPQLFSLSNSITWRSRLGLIRYHRG
jgi:hypothetical protein